MFKLLSKESNIFSIPVYIGFLLLVVIIFNLLNFSTYEAIIAAITFLGVALGYFCFNSLDLNYHTHLPLFLYTFFIFGLYPGNMDIGLAIALLNNSFLLLLLTSPDEEMRKKSFVLVGAIIGLNFVFLPTTWPMAVFIIFHIVATSQKIALNIFRFAFGISLIAIGYFSAAFFMGYTTWNPGYLPLIELKIVKDISELIPLIPVALLVLFAVWDHFRNYNKKSPTSRFKYTFLLIYSLAQLISILLYMDTTYEYLMLLALPFTIILSRMIKFLPKAWMRETCIWVIIICLCLYKVGTYVPIF